MVDAQGESHALDRPGGSVARRPLSVDSHGTGGGPRPHGHGLVADMDQTLERPGAGAHDAISPAARHAERADGHGVDLDGSRAGLGGEGVQRFSR